RERKRRAQPGHRAHVHHQPVVRPRRGQPVLHPSGDREPHRRADGPRARDGRDGGRGRRPPWPRRRSPRPRAMGGRRAAPSLPRSVAVGGAPVREPAGLPARLAAAEILHAVIDRKRPFDEVFGAAAAGGSLAGFDHRDRGLVRLIVVTALRRRGQIDDVLARFVERPLPSGAGIARAILACATAQLLFLDTPAHAAIGLAVAAADRRARRYKGLVNAVLRRVAEHGPAQVAAHDAPRINTPDWLWRRWTAAYGAATTRAIAEVHLNEPALDLTVRHDPEEWADRLGGHVTPTGTVRTTRRGAVDTLPGYSDGAWWVQDMAAAIPARLLGDISGKTVLDLCAAPGGKTAQLAAAGAEVVAVDVSPRRLRLVEQNLSRLGLKAQTVEADILAWQPDRPFDAILLDAPCTSTGTIRRHPDVAHLKTADRKSTRLNSSHVKISYAVFCLKKKK